MSKLIPTVSTNFSVDSGIDSSPDSNFRFQRITDPANAVDMPSERIPAVAELQKIEQVDETPRETSREEAIVSSYFDALNAGNFQAVANLFAEEGVLHPPFDSAVTGREAIITYLEAEAKGLQLTPKRCVTQLLDDGNRQCQVIGKVQTPLFGVNVGWTFVLNSSAEILSVQVKLMAALEELLKLQSKP